MAAGSERDEEHPPIHLAIGDEGGPGAWVPQVLSNSAISGRPGFLTFTEGLVTGGVLMLFAVIISNNWGLGCEASIEYRSRTLVNPGEFGPLRTKTVLKEKVFNGHGSFVGNRFVCKASIDERM